jgi:signal peptidase I
MGRFWQKLTVGLIGLGVATAAPVWSDVSSSTDPIYSESFCLKIFEEVAEKARSSNWQISDRDRHILTQCRAKFPPTINTQIPLPTAVECVYVIKTLIQDGVSKVKEIELPEEKVKSIERCDEVITYYSVSLENMLPTLKLTDKVIIDKTVDRSQPFQRGDIVAFNPGNLPQSGIAAGLLIQRAVGLPGETVEIKNGRVYINDQLHPENYIIQSSNRQDRSFIIPSNSYLVIGDNRNILSEKIINRQAIVGKVVWFFGGRL